MNFAKLYDLFGGLIIVGLVAYGFLAARISRSAVEANKADPT
jgi:hypothetical protein